MGVTTERVCSRSEMTFETFGNRRVLCRQRNRLVGRLIRQAMIDGDLSAFRHYDTIQQTEIQAYMTGSGRYGT